MSVDGSPHLYCGREPRWIDRRRRKRTLSLLVPGIVLLVTGIVALIVSLTKGPNLGISRRTGVTLGAVLLALGAGLLIYTAASQ